MRGYLDWITQAGTIFILKADNLYVKVIFIFTEDIEPDEKESSTERIGKYNNRLPNMRQNAFLKVSFKKS